MRRGAAVLLVASACGRVAFDPIQGDGAVADDMVTDSNAADCTTYTFDALPPEFELFGTGVVSTPGTLRCDVPAAPGGAAAIRTIPNVSFVGRSTTVRVVQAAAFKANDGPGWHTATASVHLHITSGQLVAFATGSANASVPYTPALQWLRIREANGTIFAEYSANATTWTTLTTYPAFADLASANLDLGTDNSGQATQADVGIFDDLAICPPL